MNKYTNTWNWISGSLDSWVGIRDKLSGYFSLGLSFQISLIIKNKVILEETLSALTQRLDIIYWLFSDY